MNLQSIINTDLAKLDENGIWVSRSSLAKTDHNTRGVWESIYNFDDEKLAEDRKDFSEVKLEDHLKYINPSYKFDRDTIYLEIGCGPAYIAEYLMKEHDVTFVGLDFNYQILLALKKYLIKHNLNKFILIHSDMVGMPLLNNTIDYIYGGGVMEHVSDTADILHRLHKLLKQNGVVFNTVPAFNFWWLMRFYNNIPAMPKLKQIFEKFHINYLNYKILNKYYGYELSYSGNLLYSLHQKAGFKEIRIGPFAIRPSKKLSFNKFLVDIYMKISENRLTAPVYYVSAKK